MKNLNGCVRRLTRRRLRAFQKKLEPFLPNSLGTETNIQVRREDAALAPTLPPTAVRLEPTRVRLEPENISLEIGQKTSIDVIAENVKDLFSVPFLLQYDPRILSIEEVHHGDLLSGGTQEIALVQNIDRERGQAIISLTRQPNTLGVNGTGTLASVVVRAIGTGSSKLSIARVRASDSQQKQIPVLTGDASLRVHE